jgi:UV DNA damage repair endonuclease
VNPPPRCRPRLGLCCQFALAELDYQAEVAEWVGADAITIHGGGAYSDRAAALRTLRENIEPLPAPVRSRLTLENDDKIFKPSELLPVCADTGVPLVYDVQCYNPENGQFNQHGFRVLSM